MRTRRALALLACLLAMPASAVRSQVLVGPSMHFGAEMYPEPVPITQFGANFDRFTRYGKERDSTVHASPAAIARYFAARSNSIDAPKPPFKFEPYNGIPQTMGLNLLAYATTRQTPWSGTTLYRLIAQVGYSADNPTRWAQHQLHQRLFCPPLDTVPDSGYVRHDIDVGASGDVTKWFAVPSWLPTFIGGGASLSTIYQEGFVHAGVRGFPQLNKKKNPGWPHLSAMARLGATRGGDAFPDSTLNRYYVAGSYSAALPLRQLIRDITGMGAGVTSWVPDYERTLSRDNGFFRTLSGGRKHEYFVSWRLTFNSGALVAESWNDKVNNKDKGPTGGLRIYADVHKLPHPSWLIWLIGP